MDKQEFESAYASRSGLTIDRLYGIGGHAEVCECGEDDCEGWKMVFPEHNDDLWAALVMLNEDCTRRAWGLKQLEQSTMRGACRGLREAWCDLMLQIADAFGFHRICSWMTRIIRRFTPGR